MPTDPKTPDYSSESPTPTYGRQLSLQLASAFCVLSVAWPYFGLRAQEMPWLETALAIGLVSFVAAAFTRQDWWWRLIHLAFAPATYLGLQLAIPPAYFLLAFILMLLVYRGALTGQIPLFLSNKETALKLLELLPTTGNSQFLDIGAGIGSISIAVAKNRPGITVYGIENAPATWLVGFVRTRGIRNCRWLWGDLWKKDLSQHDVVYAFLSPAPMQALWEKVVREMRPGSLFISNSFPVPGIEAHFVIDVGDARGTQLFCYNRSDRD